MKTDKVEKLVANLHKKFKANCKLEAGVKKGT